MPHVICDRSTYRITRREYTDEGFLRVPGNVSRIGIQDYLASELGLPGNPNRIVKVYRPPEEVFHPDSLASFVGADVTVKHPDGLVNSENYKKVTAGVTVSEGRPAADGIHVEADFVVKDKSAINDIERGLVELSAGYTAVYDETPGVTPEGEHYDMKQTQIRINHVALVPRGRAQTARLFDHSNEGKPMHKIALDSGRSVEVSDEATALLVSDTIERLTKRVADAEANAEKLQATADARAEELEQARKASSDAAITERVTAISQARTSAAKLAGDGFTCDSVSIAEIQRAALAVRRPKIAWGDKSDIYVQAAFEDACSAMEEEEEETKDAGGRGKKRSADAAAQLAADGARHVHTDGKQVEVVDHYQDYKASLSKAWQKGE